MKPLIVSSSDQKGGAARAAFRLTTSLRKSKLIAEMLVDEKKSDHHFVKSPSVLMQKARSLIRIQLSKIFSKLLRSDNSNVLSGNWFATGMLNSINTSDADIVNLHWVNGEMISISQIAKINKPIVMTIHDMWAFCGGEHYVEDNKNSRFRLGYYKGNKPNSLKGLDLDKIVWNRKLKSWNKKFNIVTPSNWLSKCASESLIFKGWPIYTIPNALDTNAFKPMDKQFCREMLGLNSQIIFLGFSALGGGADPRKGFDLLAETLLKLSKEINSQTIECVIVGQSEPVDSLNLGFKTHFLGHVADDSTLSLFYNSIDIMIVPSRQENLPQTATEAQSCGTPVVAFNTTGFADAVEHMVTGYLARPFDCDDLVTGINLLLHDDDLHHGLSINARKRAIELWSEEVISVKYQKLFESIITDSRLS